MSSKASAQDFVHPYYPWDLKLKHYIPNDKSTLQLLGISGLAVVVIIIVAWILSGKRKEQFCFMRRAVLCWFLVCAFIHIVQEGYFVVYHRTLAGHTSFLGQLWKEYSKGDSRYLTSDSFLVPMVSITAIVKGPLAFIAFFAFLKGSDYRYALQLTLSLLHLYGLGLYYLTEIFQGLSHGPGPRGKDRMVFYCYFLGVKLVWMVIPLALIYDAVRHMAQCQHVSDFYVDEYNRKHLKYSRKMK